MRIKHSLIATVFSLISSSLTAAPFDACPSQAFLMQDRVANLYGVDLSTGYYDFLAPSLATDDRINGIGFSFHDAYLYGWGYEFGTVVQIGDDYSAQALQVSGLPVDKGYYVGDVSLNENAYYVYRKGSQYGLYKIPLDPNAIDYLQATKIIDGANLELRIYDFAFHPSNGLLYSVDRNGLLQSIDASTGALTTIASLSTTGTFGAVYFDVDGNLYYSRNSDGNIFRLNPTDSTPTPELYAYGPKSSQNDGARCALAPAIDPNVPTTDFGDAPDSYGTLFDNNGARHSITGNSLTLGATRDAEADAYVFPIADDDVDTGNDDGIQFITPLVAGEVAMINVTANGAGILSAWFDWNGDGDFDSGEGLGDNNLIDGSQIVTFTVPLTAVSGDTWARFRLSSSANLGATGGAADGEVEDYPVEVLPCDCTQTFYPSKNDWVTLVYEDLWPAIGDYDMNDLVVYYRTSVVKSNDDVVSLNIEGELAAIGATFHNGFAVRLPGVNRTDVNEAQIVYKINGVPQNRQPLETGQTDAIIVISEDVWDEVIPTDTCGFYRTQLPCDDPIEMSFSIKVPLSNIVDINDIGRLVFDPFLFATAGFPRNEHTGSNPGREVEVHLKNFANTTAADTSLFGAAGDSSNPVTDTYYQAENGIPFAMEIGTRWAYPLETVDLVEAYPDFINYVLSGGQENTDWYLLENADTSKIYPH